MLLCCLRFAHLAARPVTPTSALRELTRGGVEHSPSVEQFADGLETLADLFGKDDLRAKWKEASSFSRWAARLPV